MKSTAYVLGVACGILAALIVVFIIRIVLKKRFGVCSNEYDERQKAIQGAGYKYAYLTLLAILAAGGIGDMLMEGMNLPLFPFAMTCIWLSACVFITYCILRDAYFSLRSKRKLYIALFLGIGIINLGIGAVNFATGHESYPWINLITGISLIYLAVVCIAKALQDRRQEVEE